MQVVPESDAYPANYKEHLLASFVARYLHLLLSPSTDSTLAWAVF